MKTALNIVKITAIVCFCLCILLYFVQEKLIFFPEKLAATYKFKFDQGFEELYFKATDNTVLNGVLFKADSSRGLIFYLHGNAGSLASWGQIAKTYTDLHYDLFMLDYRGYGKSEGSISNEKQFYEDVQLAYDSLKNRYNEKDITILGYSIGTGAAAKLAAANHPRLLILQAPYFSLIDMMKYRFRFIPSFILKYKFETNIFLSACKMPVVIFHGDKDEVIYYGSSLKLKKLFKTTDTLITLSGEGHNGMSDNPAYLTELQKKLSQ
ncbi:MAG TPA: alpha/beta fold hydrolase [Chitinophagaceae bacterium]|nr:alpha/beta fold hydrolase [Chitinophagaceae bacterium]